MAASIDQLVRRMEKWVRKASHYAVGYSMGREGKVEETVGEAAENQDTRLKVARLTA